MSILSKIRKAIKVVGLLDALIDEFEREMASEQAKKDKSECRVSDFIRKEVKN